MILHNQEKGNKRNVTNYKFKVIWVIKFLSISRTYLPIFSKKEIPDPLK